MSDENKEAYEKWLDDPNTILAGGGGWNVIRVTTQGWNIDKSPIIFRRYRSQLGQILPSTKYADDIFDQFMRLLNK